MSAINYSEKIPNNVDLGSDRTLQRALEQWQPNFINWWDDMGPEGTTDNEVYLRTAVSVDPQGWAQFGHVKMRDYRWGIFLNQGEADRTIHFGDHKGEKAWQDVPGEHRANLRRIIVTQGDTEPASVEQQRHLGKTAPSMYDLRNLFQINVEEGRHLWAMVYLLHKHFGRDGREEAEALLERRSGQEDNPRILQAFNEETPDWLSFFMFTYFTDRDGKFQLCALAESSFDPLARTTKFMLTEEAHHMFVGESGISRVIQRTCAAMNEMKTDDVGKLRAAGVIDLPTIQRYLNFHFSVTIDLFGADESSNAATFYSTGIKGRYEETKRDDDHVLRGQTYKVLNVVNGQLQEKEVPMLNALNEVLRDDYIKDSVGGVERWNRVIEKAGLPHRLSVPHKAFHRNIGALSGAKVSPDGRVVSENEWNAKVGEWLPTAEDRAFVQSLMGRVAEPGKFANWIAPPAIGINRQPVDFEYVRFNESSTMSETAELLQQHVIDPEVCIRCNTCEATCPVGAVTHDSRNYVVDPDKCNHCMACVPPCPTGSIDHWLPVLRSKAYSLEEQLSWDELPAAQSVDALPTVTQVSGSTAFETAATSVPVRPSTATVLHAASLGACGAAVVCRASVHEFARPQIAHHRDGGRQYASQ
jgi:benzoyl-CoA 2,3-epoxidase subunit B